MSFCFVLQTLLSRLHVLTKFFPDPLTEALLSTFPMCETTSQLNYSPKVSQPVTYLSWAPSALTMVLCCSAGVKLDYQDTSKS